MAIFAIAALTSASASAAIELLNKNGQTIESGLKFTGHTTTTTKLQILEGFTETKCPEILIEEERTSARLGVSHFHWHKCTASIGGTGTGSGDETGLILALGICHLVEDKISNDGTLGAGILFLVEHVYFACKTILGTTLALVNREVLRLITLCRSARKSKSNANKAQKSVTQARPCTGTKVVQKSTRAKQPVNL